jgi:hypothetical protein
MPAGFFVLERRGWSHEGPAAKTSSAAPADRATRLRRTNVPVDVFVPRCMTETSFQKDNKINALGQIFALGR